MAHAAVVSLMNNIEHLTDHGDQQIISAAHDELKLLKDALTRSYGCGNTTSDSGPVNLLDDQITEAIRNLEDAVEQRETEEMGSCLVTMKNLREEFIRDSTTRKFEEQFAREKKMKEFGVESEMIGLSDKFEAIREEILRKQVGLKTMSLSGMAGIGKTLFAREIYQLPDISMKFRVRVWVTLGPKPCIGNVLIDIATQIGLQVETPYKKDGGVSLTDYIHQNLYGRTYFIVLDDIWSHADWIQLKMWFPDPEKGNDGLLLLTTRLEELAKSPSKSKCIHHEMRFLKQEESWNLLCRNVFGERICPPDLEESGRKIAEQCEGLPLLVLQVARLLSGGKVDKEYWTAVANKKNDVFTKAYESIAEVLFSSYEHLPPFLKDCFLYMAAFPQNYDIPLSKVINLWIAEDILKPNQAVECLAKLVSQSLVIVSKRSSNGTIKFAKLHSTYWHLCVVEARKNKFLQVLGRYVDYYNDSIESPSRLSVQNNVLFGLEDVYDSIASALTTRSLLCTGQDHQYPVEKFPEMELLQVLDALSIRFPKFPDEVLKLLCLKYLALTHDGKVPSSISKLQNLQSLILRQHNNIKSYRDPTFLPSEIWDMQELKHVRIMGSNLPDPREDVQLPKLLTLHVTGQSCTEKVFRSTPKLKKLGIKIELRPRSTEILNCFEHIAILQELEKLKCVVVNPRFRFQVVAPPVSFPESLKKLSLSGLGFSWKHMSVIGSLPHLQVLKLRRSAFRGPEWETNSEEFVELKYLLLEDIDLETWTTEDDDCFNSLEYLIIRHCYKLQEIPENVGHGSCMKRMEILDCNRSIVVSANNIKDEEDQNGNEILQVPVSSFWEI